MKRLLTLFLLLTIPVIHSSTPFTVVTHNGRSYELKEQQLLEYQRLLRKDNNEQVLKEFFTGVQKTALEQLPEAEKERILTAQKRWNGYSHPAQVLHVVRELKDKCDPLLLDAFKQWAAKQTIKSLNATDPNEQITNPDDQGFFPLFTAARNGNTALVSTLLEFGAAIDQVRKNSGASSLYAAAIHGHSATVEVLIKANANVNQPKHNGASPLFIACQNGNTKIAQLLITAGATVNQPKDSGATPLLIACQYGHTETVQFLITAGAQINLPMNDGPTPLYIACQKGHAETTRLLITAGAKLNQVNQYNASPLMVTIYAQKTAVAELLVKAHADLDCVTNGDTLHKKALDFALQQENQPLVPLLKTAYENKMKKDATNPHLLHSKDHACPICFVTFPTTPIVLHSPFTADKTDVTKEKHLCCSDCTQQLLDRNREGLLLCPQCRIALPQESLQKQVDWFKELEPELAMLQELQDFRNILLEPERDLSLKESYV